jgi:hypothetical protein
MTKRWSGIANFATDAHGCAAFATGASNAMTMTSD